MIINMQIELSRRHGGTERIFLENTFSFRSQLVRILQQLRFAQMEEKFSPAERDEKPISRS